MADVKEIYKRHYDEDCTHFNDHRSKYEWAAGNVFDLTTYDGWLDELFVKHILEVCKVILDRTNFEYIKDEHNYVRYILVCQLLNDFRWIEWGTSIRGAWFQEEYFKPWGSDTVIKSRPILNEYEWSEFNSDNGLYEDHVIEEVPFTEENIAALIEFICDDGENKEET